VPDKDLSSIVNIIESAAKDFRFKYVGGGYFRDKNILVRQKADILHGSEIIEEFSKLIIRLVKE
jgi:ribosomal protein L27